MGLEHHKFLILFRQIFQFHILEHFHLHRQLYFLYRHIYNQVLLFFFHQLQSRLLPYISF